MLEKTYSKERALESIKNAVLQMPNSLGNLYNQLNQQEKEICINLIFYGQIYRVSMELEIEIKTIENVESKIKDYLLKNIFSLKQDLKKLEEDLSSRADKLNIELSDVVSEH